MKTPAPSSPFTKVAPPGFTKKSSLIAEQILHSIYVRKLPPAESKLPAERLIAEQMDVGRPAVREAISALQIVGVLDSRPGGRHLRGRCASPGGYRGDRHSRSRGER